MLQYWNHLSELASPVSMSDKIITKLHFTYKLESRTELKLKTEKIPE